MRQHLPKRVPDSDAGLKDALLSDLLSGLPPNLLPELPPDLADHCRLFLLFTRPFTDRQEDGPVRLKVEHSLRVLAHVRRLTQEDGEARVRYGAAPDLCRAALLAALYHDCGRFPQYRQYGTFLDAASFDHGRLGLRTLRGQAFLAREAPRVKRLAAAAVLLHNRYRLSPRLTPDCALVTAMVRDADKLDIMRIMAAHLHEALPDKDSVLLHVRDEPDKYSASILGDLLAGRVPRYADLRYVNDFRLLLGSWPRDLHFHASRQAVAESGLIARILEGLPADKAMAQARSVVLSLLDEAPPQKSIFWAG